MGARLLPVAIALLMGVNGGSSWAYWTAGSNPGGGGAAAATTVNQGQTPTASSAGTAITISWAPSTLSNGKAVAGYTLKRYDVASVTSQAIQPGTCTGRVTATTCTENAVPAGHWTYSVTPVFATSWSGAESLKSNSVTVEAPTPVNAISLSVVSGNAVKSGDTIYYRGPVAGSLTLTNAVSGSASGPASSTTAPLSGTSTGWTHTPSTVSTPAGGPYVSNLFSWTAGTTSAPTEVVTGRNVAGIATDTTLTFVNDATGPTGGSVDALALVGTGSRYSSSTVLSLDLAKGADALSGLSPTGAQLSRATATLTSGGVDDGVCGTFGSYTPVTGGTDPASPKADTVSDQACYKYRYVVADNLGNPTTYTSADIKVDLTAPAAPTLVFDTFTNTYWNGAGSSLFYRSAATSGSFRATAGATDPTSGIASYGFPALGASWASTPGSPGVNTYSWSGVPASPGTKSVTATNNASRTSAGTPFTLTADNTAPSAGTVAYLNGTTKSTTVSVSFTTGTDTGSGVGARALQRATTTLNVGTCGTFGPFTTLPNGINPMSPLVDTVVGNNCYKYQYVVSDNVGNTHTASSASVVKAAATYFDTIMSTPGLLSYWRLDQATTSSDSFTDHRVLLDAHTGEIGASWTKACSSTDAIVTAGDRLRKNENSSWARYYSSAVPATADYAVEADVYVASAVAKDWIGVAGRLSTSSANGTFYAAAYDQPSARWTLYSVINGTRTTLGQSTVQPLARSGTYRLRLGMAGSRISLLVNGVQQVSVVNTAITASGRGGVVLGSGLAKTRVTDTTGMHLDNFQVTPPLADSSGTSTGDYLNGTTLGVAGAVSGDDDTAAQFDGVNDYASVARQISDDVTIEFWFKSTQGVGTSTQWYAGAGLVDADVSGTTDDFGVSLRSDGKVVAGVGGGSGPDTSIVSTSGGYNDGAWHHIVFTRTITSGVIQLYVDGVPAGSATGSKASLTSPANINFGRIQTGSTYFSGSLDEVAVYAGVLTGPTVTSHYTASR